MKEFTAAEVKRHTGEVWKSVDKLGMVKINHRDRDDMIIIQKSEWDAMVKDRDELLQLSIDLKMQIKKMECGNGKND